MLAYAVCDNTDGHLIDKSADYIIYTVERTTKVPKLSPTPKAYEKLMSDFLATDIRVPLVKELDDTRRNKTPSTD